MQQPCTLDCRRANIGRRHPAGLPPTLHLTCRIAPRRTTKVPRCHIRASVPNSHLIVTTRLAEQAVSESTVVQNANPSWEFQFPKSYYDSQGRLMIKCLTMDELRQWCESIGEPGQKRALQLWRWMYYDRQWLVKLDDAPAGTVVNGFSARFRDKFRELATLDGGLEAITMRTASDGTRKIVFRLTAGPAKGGQVETVLIPIVREAGSKERITLCVSSQVGCAMGCQFCFTSKMGLLGNLTPGQIIEQVVLARRMLYEEGGCNDKHITPITNVVFMGMGEPLDNLDAVLPAIDVMTDRLGLHLSYNKICVSTVGIVPAMRRFAEASRAVMAVSLHAATDQVRSSIVPVNKRYPLEQVIQTMEELFPKDRAAPRHGHHVLIEYTMLAGVNDRPEDAQALLDLVKNIRCKINLIVFNPHEGTVYAPSSPESVAAFRDVLISGGHVATVRCSRGDDEMAACGQLGNLELRRAKSNKDESNSAQT